MSLTKEQVIDYLSNLPQMEIAGLIKELEGKWGVSATPVATPIPLLGTNDWAPAVQTEFDVILVEGGTKKIDVIKVVKDLLNLGLKEAKDFVEAAPKRMKEGVSRADADEIRTKIEAAGGKVEIK